MEFKDFAKRAKDILDGMDQCEEDLRREMKAYAIHATNGILRAEKGA